MTLLFKKLSRIGIALIIMINNKIVMFMVYKCLIVIKLKKTVVK